MANLVPYKKSNNAIIKADKFLPRVKTSSLAIGKDFSKLSESPLMKIERKVIKIDSLLKDSLLLARKQNEKGRVEKEEKKFQQREKELEKKKAKVPSGVKFPTLPGAGILGWVRNFVVQTVLGFLAVRLIDHLPTLLKVLPTIIKVGDFFIDVGGKLLDGLVTFVDKAYDVVDNTRKFAKQLGGEGLAQNFDKFAGALSTMMDVAIIAAMSAADMSGDGGGGFDFFERGPKKGFDKFGRRVGTRAQERYLQRYGEKQFAERFGEKALKRVAARGAEQAVEKSVLRTIVKRIPIVGALLDFALNYFVFHEPLGESAFRAAGSTLLGFIGGAIGSIFPGPGTLIGGALGGLAGDAVASVLYDRIFKGKKPTTQVAKAAGGGQPTTRGGKLVGGPAKRSVKKKKTPRTLAVTPKKLKPGSAVGGEKKIKELYPESKDKTKMSPFDFIKNAYEGFSKSSGLGSLIAIAIKPLMGDRPTYADYKNAGIGVNNWMNQSIGSGTYGYAGGGEVKMESIISGEDYSDVIAKSLQDSVAPQIDKTIQDLMRQMTLKKVQGEDIKKEEVPSSGQTGVEGAEDFSGSSGAEKAMHYLISQGLTGAQAAGIAGNLQQESGFNPGADNGSHHGIAQWDKENRWPRVSAYISSVGKDPNSLEGQLVGLKWEAQQRGDWNAIKSASNARQASAIWLERFERSGEKPGMPGFENRMKYANDLLAKYGNYVPQSTDNAAGFSKGGVGGSVAEYITGDPNTPFGRFDRSGHGMTYNYHDHIAFRDRSTAVRAYNFFKSKGLQVTEFKGYGPVGGHASGSYHYSGLAFDVPGAQWGGSGAIGSTEYRGSAKVRSVLKQFLGGGSTEIASRFQGGTGYVSKDGFTLKLHKGEMYKVVDRDSVDLFSKDFIQDIINIENKSQLIARAPSIIQKLKSISGYTDYERPEPEVVYLPGPVEYVPVPMGSGGSPMIFGGGGDDYVNSNMEQTLAQIG